MSAGEGDFSQSGYSDWNVVSDYALKPMKWCFDNNVMFAYSETGYEYVLGARVAPTRGYTAVFFSKFAYLLENGQ